MTALHNFGINSTCNWTK